MDLHNHSEESSINNPQAFPLVNAVEHAILMHRDAHFGGKFEFMLEYYRNAGKGSIEDIHISAIEGLDIQEQQMGVNLAATLLTGSEAERVAEAKAAYQKLRDLYENPTAQNRHMRLLADLILSEEDEPTEEIDAIISEKLGMIPSLIELLRSEEFYDPLFPGYGLAPGLAAKCLGKIGDKRAIISLFESIGEGDFFNEDLALHALKMIGEPAKQFLLKVLHGRPYNMDNERAAIALEEFKDDQEVATACFNLLKELNVKQNEILATYLVLACEGLEDPELKAEFEALAANDTLPKSLRQDVKLIAQKWHDH